MFRFATPEYFYLLLILPLLWGVHLLSARARRRAIERFGDPATVSELMPEASTARPRYKFVLFSAAVLLLVVALARPQFGSKLKEVTRTGIEMMLAVDVSNSMLAQDFEPSRLERTKFAIDRLTQQLEQDRIGLIVFAGDAYMQLPITSDYVAARSFAAQISPTMVSKQGTAIGAAIDLAASSFSSGSEGSRVIVVISDGENHEDDALAAAKAAAEKGIRIYTIGIGTPEGAPISIDGEFIKDEPGRHGRVEARRTDARTDRADDRRSLYPGYEPQSGVRRDRAENQRGREKRAHVDRVRGFQRAVPVSDRSGARLAVA